MLVALAIRDIVLIDRLDLDFAPGLSVLTGETGAGKSIVLDAFSLALGARGDGGLVRSGAAQGQVTAIFAVDEGHPVRAFLGEQGIAADDPELILRRVQFADGRTRAFVDDQPVGVQMLKSAGQMLVEIHGQHDDRALLDPSAHQAMLDAFGGNDRLAAEVRRLWGAARDAATALEAERARLEAVRRDADYLRHAHAELEKLAPEPNEETVLADRRQAIMRAGKAAEDLGHAQDALSGADAPVPHLAALIRRLERRGGGEEVAPAIRALDTAIGAIEEARDHIDRLLQATDYDSQELERNEERLFALRAASRKYQVPVDALGAEAARIAEAIEAIEAGEAGLLRLESEVAAARSAYEAAAARLSAARIKAGKKLDTAVNGELPDLKLERAKFTTKIDTDAATPGPTGIDRVEFWAQTNPGTRPGAIARIASGGELARFMLALKVSLIDRGSAPTLIFDEIDTGVGGAVADAIGQRLARLAGRVQVIAVTHAPQVAARAGGHFRIAKEARGRSVATGVERLGPGERREEIARMLAGASVTDEARAAAGRLIEGAV